MDATDGNQCSRIRVLLGWMGACIGVVLEVEGYQLPLLLRALRLLCNELHSNQGSKAPLLQRRGMSFAPTRFSRVACMHVHACPDGIASHTLRLIGAQSEQTVCVCDMLLRLFVCARDCAPPSADVAQQGQRLCARRPPRAVQRVTILRCGTTAAAQYQLPGRCCRVLLFWATEEAHHARQCFEAGVCVWVTCRCVEFSNAMPLFFNSIK